MFSLYLPKTLYRSLPVIYFGMALIIAAVPLVAVKWITVFCLSLAAVVTLLLRHAR